MPEKRAVKWLFWILLGWGICWSVLPLLTLRTDYVDILENIVWGSHFQWGYDKNPYVGAWIGYASWWLTGDTWISYFISQGFVITGFVATYLVAKRMVGRTQGVLSVLFLLGVTFYGMKATELCDDIMELGFWPLTIMAFYFALRDKRWFWWFLTGMLMGLSLMVKYYGAMLAISMLVVMLTTVDGRKAFKSFGPYLAALVAFLIVLPNVLWLIDNEFVAFGYAMKRASLSGGVESRSWVEHIYQPWRTFERSLGVYIVPLIFLGLFLFNGRSARTEGKEHDVEVFNRWFVTIIGVGPFVLTLLFAMFTGGSINYSWVVPCFGWVGVMFFVYAKPLVSRRSFLCYVSLMIILGVVYLVIFGVRSAYYQSYEKKRCDYENYPAREVAEMLTEEWHKRYNRPLEYVIGGRMETCSMSVYSADHPIAYFSANKLYSQWIDEEDIKRKGAVVVNFDPWKELAEDGRELRHYRLKPLWYDYLVEGGWKLTPVTIERMHRAAPGWLQKMLGRKPQEHDVAYWFIEPSDLAEEEDASNE